MGELGISRRAVLEGAAAFVLAAPALVGCEHEGAARRASSRRAPSRFLSTAELEVVEEATARLIPGPSDDPAEIGHPGAREAGVAAYVQGLLSALSGPVAMVYAGGPFSDRAGSRHDDMATFLPLSDPRLARHWRARIEGLQANYRAGIAELDRLARAQGAAGFVALEPDAQDAVLAQNPVVAHLPAGMEGFTDLLFDHSIEGTYGPPEYGGNRGLVGWKDIGYPGDVQPRGYSPNQVTHPEAGAPLASSPVVDAVLRLYTSTAPAPIRPAGR